MMNAQTTLQLLQTPAAKVEFPPLAYSYTALEPSIDSLTMRIHYSKHFRAYYDNFIKAIHGTSFENLTMSEAFSVISTAPAAVKNNAGGFYNHALYWEIMAPKSGGMPSGMLLNEIERTFGGFDNFKKAFTDAALSRFGSGWAWLIVKGDKSLAITSTPNQDNPLMDNAELKGTPILLIDVWEHAYYLKYQNKRADYVNAFWNVINWKKVSELYVKAIQ
ncbi:MAG: superoxide dismutase [Bacteroidota bacterium]|nr:superoxide dismutase [Bacteroidota bacterium]